jgi:HK97 gp10 family phage protein
MLETSLRLKGLDQVIKNLDGLKPIARRKSMEKAMFTSLRPVLYAARSNAPRSTGALKVSLSRGYVRPGQTWRGATVTVGDLAAKVVVAPKRGYRPAVALANLLAGRKRRINGIYWGHFTEFGTKRGIKGTGWMRRSLDSNAQLVIDLFEREIERQIKRALR